jgi:hypothetical protein
VYRFFKVMNFRCFPELTLDKLERVNLIAGMNNVGKTTLLEALFLHSSAYNPELILRLNAFRGIEQVGRLNAFRGIEQVGRLNATLLNSIFSRFDTSKIAELTGEYEQAGNRTLQLRVIGEPEKLAKIGKSIQPSSDIPGDIPLFSSDVAYILELVCMEGGQTRQYYLRIDEMGIHVQPMPPRPPFLAVFLASRVRPPLALDAEYFGNLEVCGRQDEVLDALQVVEPRLKRLAVVPVGGLSMIHGDIGLGRLVPLPVMGEGMQRLASLVLAIANLPNGVVLVDEIENGLYYSILPKVWQAIGKAAREFNTQVFATTHSLECIEAAHRAFSESERYDFRLHRLERVNETIRAVPYDQESLDAAIEMGWEVR